MKTEILRMIYAAIGGMLGGWSIGMAFTPIWPQPKNFYIQLIISFISLIFIGLLTITIIK